ncbi:MAG TPA: CAP domain-containing protein [Solirubrobacteraceae bacterium]|nr:CAP domain-containing protein [Solirubrobacteraceae bacterium]
MAVIALVLAVPGAAQPAAAQPIAAQPAGACPGASLRPTGTDLAAVDAATACLIDRERGAARLGALRANGSLQRVAARQSREMVLGDYFGDDNRAGQTPLQRIVATRYLRHAAAVSTAQNIGWGTGAQATPAAIVAAWMASPPHREIVLTDEFRDIGVGAAPAAPAALAAGEPGATYTVEFGARG